jgi:hypothetical protein
MSVIQLNPEHPTAWPCTASMLVRRSGLPWTQFSIHKIVRPWLEAAGCPKGGRTYRPYFLVDEELAQRFAREHGLTLRPDPAGGYPGWPPDA